MERRDFLKISALTGAISALDGCGSPDVEQLIRVFAGRGPDARNRYMETERLHALFGGMSLTVRRVMQGRLKSCEMGKMGVIEMGFAKKLEGNPDHPVNRGKLCPRGHAGLQVVYHPDRLRGP